MNKLAYVYIMYFYLYRRRKKVEIGFLWSNSIGRGDACFIIIWKAAKTCLYLSATTTTTGGNTLHLFQCLKKSVDRRSRRRHIYIHTFLPTRKHSIYINSSSCSTRGHSFMHSHTQNTHSRKWKDFFQLDLKFMVLPGYLSILPPSFLYFFKRIFILHKPRAFPFLS